MYCSNWRGAKGRVEEVGGGGGWRRWVEGGGGRVSGCLGFGGEMGKVC